MHGAVRSRINMGIALTGAGAIALAPIAQPMPAIAELQTRAVSSAKVALTAAVNPIEQWSKIIQDALANSGGLVETYMTNPAPILHQLLINGLTYGGQTFSAVQNSFVNLVDQLKLDNPYGFPAGVQNAFNQIRAGQLYEAYNTLFSAGLGLIVGPVFPLLELLQIPVNMAQNFADVVAVAPSVLVGASFGVIGTVNGTMQATAFQAQAVLDALKARNLMGAVNALVATPGVIVNAILNGFALSGAPGLLSPGGLIDQVIQGLNTIAHALAPSAAPVAAKVADTGPSAVPSAALSTATVTLGAEKVTAPDSAKAAATKTAETKTTPAEPAAAAPVAAASPETPSTATETKPESGTTSGSTTPTGGTDTTSGTKTDTPDKTAEPTKPTKPSGSTGSETGSGSTGGTTAGAPDKTGEPTKPTKPSGSAGSETGSGNTGSGSSASGSGTKAGTPGKTGGPKKPTKPTKPSGSTGSQTGSGSTGSGSSSGASGSGSGASASGGGASHAAA
ncbi:hypothetical protein ACNO8X_25995 [Mycobacterium sp. PDNC021]|uniref:hypothetical protein n=1 Tax=Mycobacterium sp. PDNC021 TaxID=3391399 RepID=UPI003AAD0D0A